MLPAQPYNPVQHTAQGMSQPLGGWAHMSAPVEVSAAAGGRDPPAAWLPHTQSQPTATLQDLPQQSWSNMEHPLWQQYQAQLMTQQQQQQQQQQQPQPQQSQPQLQALESQTTWPYVTMLMQRVQILEQQQATLQEQVANLTSQLQQNI